jgi:hypothetical protein
MQRNDFTDIAASTNYIHSAGSVNILCFRTDINLNPNSPKSGDTLIPLLLPNIEGIAFTPPHRLFGDSAM